MIELLIVWVVCGFIAAAIGSRKGASGSSFVIGLLLGPLGIVIVLVSKGHRVECPHCRELMHPDASVCPHCQRAISAESLPICCPSCQTRGSVGSHLRDTQVECPSCKKVFRAARALIES